MLFEKRVCCFPQTCLLFSYFSCFCKSLPSALFFFCLLLYLQSIVAWEWCQNTTSNIKKSNLNSYTFSFISNSLLKIYNFLVVFCSRCPGVSTVVSEPTTYKPWARIQHCRPNILMSYPDWPLEWMILWYCIISCLLIGH